MATETAWTDELLRNPHIAADKRMRVRKMFAAIAPSYDLNNRLHSLWMDQLWRRRAVKLAEVKAGDKVVDVACGTGDLAIRFRDVLYRRSVNSLRLREDANHSYPCVVGIDFTFEMLPLARRKGYVPPPVGTGPDYESLEDSIVTGISWINGDAQALPLTDACCDVVSIAFGIRNVADPNIAMQEFRRVLRPGGRVIILEFGLPTNPVLRSLYNFYFRKILPRTATLISGDKTGAYKYLPESVNTFISPAVMMEMMRAAGFEKVEVFPMTFGVCLCYRGIAAEANRNL